MHARVCDQQIINIPQTTIMIQNESPPGLSLISFHNHGHAWWNRNHSLLLLLLLLLMQTPAPATSQIQEPPVEPINNKSTVTIMSIVAVMFLISGFLSLYSHQCAGRRTGIQARLDLPITTTVTGDLGRQSQSESLGLNQETIDTFPTFLYSSVKGHKIGTCALACAVCLSEFQDEETLRLIPKCSHVFHPSCIDVWLASHSTCPVCRANLASSQDDVVSLSIQIPNDQDEQQHSNEEQENTAVVGCSSENDIESSKNDLLRRSRTVNHVIGPTRLRSTGFLCALLFPRSNSTGHPVTVQACDDDDFERFTLRLPDEVRRQVLKKSGLKRAKSCVGFARMSSGTKGYRTRSVGGGVGRSYFQYERIDGTTPFFAWNWNRSARNKIMFSVQGSVG